jgi:hypothetical protein
VRATSISSGQRDFIAFLAECGAEQVGQVLHRLFGACRVAACQGCDGVHAVEQEVRPDAGLQCVHARLGLQLDVVPPFVGNVEVAQRERGHHQRDDDIAQQEGPVILGKLAAGVEPAGAAAEPPRQRGDHHDEERGQRQHHGRTARQRLPVQVGAQHAKRGGVGEADPQQEHRSARQVRPEAERHLVARQRQHQRRELADDHDREHRPRPAEIR